MGGMGSCMGEHDAVENAATLASSMEGGDKAEGDANDTANNDEEEKEEEPIFCAMPPMPPLPRKEEERIPSPAERIVVSALHEYGVFWTVHQALVRWIRRRSAGEIMQGCLAEEVDVAVVPLDNNQQQQRRGTSHFLFQSILHSSLPVRRAAARMILHNFHLVQQRTTTNWSRHDGGTGGRNDGSGNYRNSGELFEVLITLLQSLMFGEALTNRNQTQIAAAETNSSMLSPGTRIRQREGIHPCKSWPCSCLWCEKAEFSVFWLGKIEGTYSQQNQMISYQKGNSNALMLTMF